MKVTSAEFIKSAAKKSDFPRERLPEIAFLGRSNVGKSSLINTLTGRKGLAKTSSTPGRTRLINFFKINNSLIFVDFPGYGYAKVPASMKKEWKGMAEGYLQGREGLKGVVIIMDIRRPPKEEEEMLVEYLDSLKTPFVVALTKVDKLSGNEKARQIRIFEKSMEGILVPFSAVTGEGKNTLWKAVSSLIAEP